MIAESPLPHVRTGGVDGADRGGADDGQERGADQSGRRQAGQGLQGAAVHFLLLRARGGRPDGPRAGDCCLDLRAVLSHHSEW